MKLRTPPPSLSFSTTSLCLALWLAFLTPALAGGGKVVVWGDNTFGQTNVPPGLTNVVSLAANAYYTLAVKSDGSLASWGEYYGWRTNYPSGVTDAVAVAAGLDHSMVLRANGSVEAWGDNSQAQAGIPSGLSGVVGIKAGWHHSLALMGNGTVAAWGRNDYGVTTVPQGLSNVVAIACGADFSLALKSDGTLLAWGLVAVPPQWTNVVAIEAGTNSFLALTGDGTVLSSNNDVPANLVDVTGLAVGTGRNMVLKSDGSVVSWGADATQPAGITNAIGIAAGIAHGAAVISDGAPWIFRHPFENYRAFSGTTVFLNAGVVSYEPMNYQWRYNGSDLPGATNATLVLEAVSTNQSGTYDLAVSNSLGVAESRSALLTVQEVAPAIIAQPVPVIRAEGEQALLSVQAIGSLPLSYRWRLNGVDVPQATNASLLLTNLQIAQAGVYDVVVTNAFGTVQSSNALLQVLGLADALNTTNLVWTTSGQAPWAATLGASHDGVASAQATIPGYQQQILLGTTVTGPGTLAFWWRLGSASASTSYRFRVNGVVRDELLTGATWQRKVVYLGEGTNLLQWELASSAVAGSTNSAWLDEVSYVPGGVAPIVTTAPVSQSRGAGTDTSFSVVAEGTPPISYQWLYQSNAVAGATNASLPLVNVQTNNNGKYSVVVSNAFGSTNTAQVTLTVSPAAPTILAQPQTSVAWPHSTATLSVTAIGSAPLRYQWRRSSTNLPSATNQTLILPDVNFADSGLYSVRITNSVGSRDSVQVSLSVSPVVAWGAGTSNSTSPNSGQCLTPLGLTNATAVAGGGYHSLALRPDGRVIGWGLNQSGQTNAQTTLTNAAAIGAGLYHSLALRSNGTLVAWGAFSSLPSAATSVVSIASGWQHNLALKTNGTLVAWGTSSMINKGQTQVPTNLTDVCGVAAGGYHSLALRSNGTVVAWGWNASGQTNVPAGLSDVVAITGGGSNSIALKGDGTVVAWGDDTWGQTTIPTGLSNVVDIAAGAGHSLALRRDGTVVAWGMNSNLQASIPAGLTNFAAISAGAFHSLGTLNQGPITFIGRTMHRTIYKGDDVALSAACIGEAPITYQWRGNGVDVTGETNEFLAFHDAQLSDRGSYQLVASNVFGSVTSAPVVLTVVEASPTFTLHPASQIAWPNSNVTLTASVEGVPPLAFQWLLNGTAIPDATNLALALTNIQVAAEGHYSLLASNSFGIAISSNAFLNVMDVVEALGTNGLVWLNPSQPQWSAQRTITHDGFAAAAVGPLSYHQESSLTASVAGPGTLSFWWSTPAYSCPMSLAVDGVVNVSTTGGTTSWRQYTVYLGSGTHILTWKFVNNYYTGSSVTAYLDDVTCIVGGTPPIITAQPANQTNQAANSITFSVAATGTPPLGYQWLFNDLEIAGATGASLTLQNIQADRAGTYRALVTNGWGSALSSNAVLTVLPAAPVLTTHPVNASVLLGGQATFTGTAVGSLPIGYQWLRNGEPVLDATNTILTVGPVGQGDSATYALSASNSVGTTVSSNAVLVAYSVGDLGATLDEPAIAWSTTNVPWFPQTNTTHDGVSAAQSGAISGAQRSTLQGVVNGPATLTYWWKVNCSSFWTSLGFVMDGALQNGIGGNVNWVQVTNYIGAGPRAVQWELYSKYGAFADGTGWLDQVQVLPGATPPIITAAPVSVTNTAGDTAAFSVGCIGTPPLRYQWQLNGADLAGATNASLSLNGIQADHAGTYAVTILNDFGPPARAEATLTVIPTVPVITSQPASVSGVLRSVAAFSVAAKGSTPLSYQWHFNGEAIPGATSNSYALANLQYTNAGDYAAVVANQLGAVTSSVARLEVVSRGVRDFWAVGGYLTPAGLGDVIAVAVGSRHSLALRSDGTVISWGYSDNGATNVPAGLSNVVAIAAGVYHSVALRGDGTVVAWGDNTSGQLLVPPGLSNVTAVAAGWFNTFALKADGTVVAWGAGGAGHLDIPAELDNVQALAVGVNNGFALKENLTVTQWGNGQVWQQNGVNTQLVVAVGLSNITAVAAGAFSAWTLDTDGMLKGWGFWGPWRSGSGLPMPGVAAVAASGGTMPSDDYAIALRYGGTVATFGQPGGVPVIPSGLSNIIAVAASHRHAAVLINDGSPTVVARPLHQTFLVGSTTLLMPGVTGSSPVAFQWRLNGLDLAGETNAALRRFNLQTDQSGTYDVIVTNAYGVVTNQVTTLTVQAPQPVITGVSSGSGAGAEGFGFDIQGPPGLVVMVETSSDFLHWTPISTHALVNGLARFTDPEQGSASSRFYRVRFLGAESSAPVLQPAAAGRAAANPFGFYVTSMPGARGTIYATTNLANWTPLEDISFLTGYYYFNDPGSVALPQRYYRVVLWP